MTLFWGIGRGVWSYGRLFGEKKTKREKLTYGMNDQRSWRFDWCRTFLNLALANLHWYLCAYKNDELRCSFVGHGGISSLVWTDCLKIVDQWSEQMVLEWKVPPHGMEGLRSGWQGWNHKLGFVRDKYIKDKVFLQNKPQLAHPDPRRPLMHRGIFAIITHWLLCLSLSQSYLQLSK